MQALLVVDIDHNDNWGPKYIQENNQKKQVMEEIKKVLKEKRAKKEIIVFIVLTSGGKITGQEAQLECRPPRDTAQDNELTVEHSLNQLEARATKSQSGKCIVCEELPEYARLASFLKHRHGTEFEPAFIKTRGNAFTNQALAPYLRSMGVDEIILAGCNTFQCVLDTAVGALEAGFHATLLSRCAYPPLTGDLFNNPTWSQNAQNRSGQSKFRAEVI